MKHISPLQPLSKPTWYMSQSMVTPPNTEVTVPDSTLPAPCATSFAISLFTFSPNIEPTASKPAIMVCSKIIVEF